MSRVDDLAVDHHVLVADGLEGREAGNARESATAQRPQKYGSRVARSGTVEMAEFLRVFFPLGGAASRKESIAMAGGAPAARASKGNSEQRRMEAFGHPTMWSPRTLE